MKLFVTGGCGFIGSNFINYGAMYYCASEENVLHPWTFTPLEFSNEH